MIDDERRDVMRAQRREVDVGRSRRLAGRPGIEDASAVAASPARRARPRARHLATGVVRRIACARVGAAIVGSGHEAARIGSGRGHASGRGVDRGGVARLVQPAGEEVPAQGPRHPVAVGVVALEPEMKLAEQRALVAAHLEELRRSHFERRDHRVRQVGGTEGPKDIRAQRVAPHEQCGTAGRTRRHRPRVVKAYALAGERIDGGRGRGRGAAVAERPHLVDPDIVHDDEQDVGRVRRCMGQPGHHRQSWQEH